MENNKMSKQMLDSSKHTESKQTITYHLLKEALIHQEFAEGTVLTERKLCSIFGVSRPPVHHAVQLLIAEGLLRLTKENEMVVPVLSAEDLKEIYEMLEMIQVSAYTLNRSILTENLLEMKHCLKKMDDVARDAQNSPYERFVLDRKFHEQILRNVENERMKECFRKYSDQYAVYTLLFSKQLWNYDIKNIHEQIYLAVSSGSQRDVSRALHAHYADAMRMFKTIKLEST